MGVVFYEMFNNQMLAADKDKQVRAPNPIFLFCCSFVSSNYIDMSTTATQLTT
jgi:hypothetical protein